MIALLTGKRVYPDEAGREFRWQFAADAKMTRHNVHGLVNGKQKHFPAIRYR